ncbi:MAG: hypothetical protein HKN76_05465, partial [Saprospiraceae bacterium]|nr:hypothetical protein [Saprospiraceae bacterium]
MTPSCWPWIILTILTCYLPVYAQNDNLRFQHFVPEDGLSNSSVKCIQQDHQGFIWIGTANGLNRFDGHHFIKYKHQKNNTFSLTDNSINALYEDQQERLWVGTDIGLHLYDRVLDQFTRIPGPRINDKPVSRIISAILEDQDGNFWLGTDGGGFYGFNSKTMEFTPYRKEGQHHGQNSVHCLYQDSQDRLWVGTFGGLFQFDIYSREFVHYPNHELLGSDMNEDYVWDITEASDGSLWIGTIGNGLYLFQPQDNSFTHIQKLIPDAGLANAKNIQSLGIDDRSRIWIGTGTKGVLVFDHPSQEIIKCVNIPFDNSSISSNEIQVIYKDSAEDIWIGTRSQGISHWSRRNTAFRHIKHSAFQPKGLTSNMVTSFFKRGSGEIWIGTFGGGLNLYDPSNNHYKHYRNELNNTNSLGSDFILSVLEDSKGHVWTLHSKWGVTRFDPRVSSTAFRQYRIRYVLSIFEDSKDRIWLGAGFGLSQYDAHSDTFILCQKDTTIASSQIMTSVVAIYEDINKKMWFGSY